jgi:hypothetical protein
MAVSVLSRQRESTETEEKNAGDSAWSERLVEMETKKKDIFIFYTHHDTQ